MSCFKVAAIGAAAIVSKTVTTASEPIDYERVIEIIQGKEKEEEEQCNPPATPTSDTEVLPSVPAPNTEVPAQDTNATPAQNTNEAPVQDANADETPPQDVDVDAAADGELPAQDAAVSAPANDISILRTRNKIYVGDDKLPEVVIRDLQYNPVKESIRNPHTSQDNRSEHPNISYSQLEQLQPVSSIGSSSDSRDEKYRSGKSIPDAVDGMQNEEAEESENIRINSSPQESNEKYSTNDQNEQQFYITNTPILEDAKSPYPDEHSKKHCDGTTSQNPETILGSTNSKYKLVLSIHLNASKPLSDDQNMQSLPPSGVHTPSKTEEADPTNSKIQGQYNQSSSGNTVEMQHNEGPPYRFDNSAQSQSLKHILHNKPQSSTRSSLNSEIKYNSQDPKLMPSASTVKNKESDSKHTSSTSSNPSNTGLCGCKIF